MSPFAAEGLQIVTSEKNVHRNKIGQLPFTFSNDDIALGGPLSILWLYFKYVHLQHC